MFDTTKYPHFITDAPVGEDCFEGHSQQSLAHSICNYVRRADAMPDSESTPTMPRIIGLEGSWGSGKSNVVSMIERELKSEGYYTFTYDAWGHQEDLQRRSILETLTTQLIRDKALQGKVEIHMRNGKRNKAEWKDQLSLLLSNKTTTIRKSTPQLTPAAGCGIFVVALYAICTHITELWAAKTFPCEKYWLLDLLPVVVALFAVAYFWRKKDGVKNIFRMVDHTNSDQIDEEYTSSEEPSVAEFKNWMRAVSDYLSTTKQTYNRLIIVFDNMDRLPSEKVMQLWSSIYTFFAGGEFKQVWTIIPYDYMHLCQAINGDDTGNNFNEGKKRIKQFISKTFPIIYHVPQPVITDYRKLFFAYFDKAFGSQEHDREHICQVFMHLRDNPNPRIVISFVNELVALRLQWSGEAHRLQNLALYALKKDELLYEGESLEANLLSDDLFDRISPFYPNRDAVRTVICQYAYGLEDAQLASEVPLRLELKRHIKAGEPIDEYAMHPNFLSVLESVLSDEDIATVDNAVKSLTSLDGTAFSDGDKQRIQSKWDMLANLKADSVYDKHEYDDTLTVLIHHATSKRVEPMARKFAKAMQQLKVEDGVKYFHTQHQLQMALQEAQVVVDDSNWYRPVSCEPQQFAEYVCEAKELYVCYGLTAETQALNDYLFNGAVSGNAQVSTVINYINGDALIDLSDLQTKLTEAIEADNIKEGIPTSAYIHRLLAKDKEILKVRFKASTISTYLQGVPAPWENALPNGLEDVVAMSLADGKDVEKLDPQLLSRLSDCMGYYMSYTDLLKNMGREGSAFRLLNVYCIEQLKGGPLDNTYAARHLKEIQDALKLDPAKLLRQFNRWSVIDWGEISADNEFVKDVKNYVHHSFLMAYRDNPGNFSDSIISLGVHSIPLQSAGFLAKMQSVQPNYRTTHNILVIDDFWKDFINTYLGTAHLVKADELITSEAVTMLSWLYQQGEDKDPELLDKILQYADEATLKSYLHKLLNEQLVTSDITKQKFLRFGRLIPQLTADMNANTARGLMEHFIKPICKDAECADVIVKYKDFYLAVMRLDKDIASPIAKEMEILDCYAYIKDEISELQPQIEDNRDK